MTDILKASEIPPGARILNGQGRALTGAEVALGLRQLVEREVGSEAADAIADAITKQYWPGIHLTFPNVKIEWCSCTGEDGKPGLWLFVHLMRTQEWEWHWNDELADIRNLVKVGPFRSPDEMREALGLARIAQFRMPDGAIVTAELPRAALYGKEKTKEEVLAGFAEVPQLVKRPSEPVRLEVPEASEAELLAEPPQVSPTEPAAEPLRPPKKVELKKAAGRKR